MVELGIGAAASVHLTVSTPAVTYPTGVMNADTEDTLVENDDEWTTTGVTFAVSDRPGLGVDPDLDAVERLRVD